MKQDIVLAFETGIGGGSISLFRSGEAIDSSRGKAKASRAEDLLIEIESLLKKNDLRLKDIKIVFVSKGPGSLTGLRIGEATAKGLQKSLNCSYQSVFLLEALALKAPPAAVGTFAVAVSAGIAQAWRQIFSVKSPGEIIVESHPSKIDLQKLFSDAEELDIKNFLLEKELFEKAKRTVPDFRISALQCTKLDEPLSKFIGLKGMEDFFR